MDTAQQAKQIFLRMVDELPQEEWLSQLEERCAGDEVLIAQVAALLRAHCASDSFLEYPAVEAVTAEHIAVTTEKPGEMIDRYKLLEQIGEGGFGVVYMAEQTEPVHRRVALKIIKPGMDSKEVVARFEAERQALALMEHPNIARVLDAGTTDSGRPYFVMELVRGIPIIEYCDKHNLSTKERLQLFIDVCHGVQHAHQKGIIHRDIKPSNILVTLHDGVPVPKVIDFGIAKAISQRLTEKTLFTSYGQFIGTPQYMSPEQSEMSGLDIDTRCDIYALGALLYELLTGSPPFDPARLRSAGFVEVLRIIREEEPPKPSLRLSTRKSLPAITTREQVEPKKLNLIIRGELDWIVMKALEKDRSRRYETANGLASDIRRYLKDEPVTACPPSATYRFQKFVRRNKVAMATVSIVAMALIAGLVGTTWQAIRARKAEKTAQHNLQEAVLAQEKAEAERSRADENFRRARQAVDEYFTLVSESTLLDEEGMQPLRRQLLESALQYFEEFSQQQTDDPELLAELAATQFRIAITQIAAHSTDWLQPLHASWDILERLQQKDVDASLLTAYREGAFRYHGFYDIHFKNAEEAALAFERGTKILGKLVSAHPNVAGFQHDLAGCHLMAGKIHSIAREWTPAIENLNGARKIWESNARDGHATGELAGRLGDVYRLLADAYEDAGLYEQRNVIFQEGIATLRSVFGDMQPEIASLLRVAPFKSLDEREANLREAIKIYHAVLSQPVNTPRSMPEVRWNLSRAHASLGRLLQKAGNLEDAEKELLTAKQLANLLVEQNPSNREFQSSFADTCRDLGIALRNRRRMDEAEQEFLRSRKVYQSLSAQYPTNSDYHYKTRKTDSELGLLYSEMGRTDEAESLLLNGVKDLERLVEVYPTEQSLRAELGHALWNLGEYAARKDRVSEAEQYFCQALNVFEKARVDYPDWEYARWEEGYTHWLIGNLFEHNRRLGEAEQAYLKAFAVNKALCDDFPQNQDYALRLAQRFKDLIRCSLKQEEYERAIELGGQALAFCQSEDGQIRPGVEEELPWLKSLLQRAKTQAQPESAPWRQKFEELVKAFRQKSEEVKEP